MRMEWFFLKFVSCQAENVLHSLEKLTVIPFPQRGHVETHLPSHTPSCRATLAWRWGMSSCMCVPRGPLPAIKNRPSPCCVTAVGNGMAWCRPAGKVSFPRAGRVPCPQRDHMVLAEGSTSAGCMWWPLLHDGALRGDFQIILLSSGPGSISAWPGDPWSITKAA
jgi:hypothetical protein